MNTNEPNNFPLLERISQPAYLRQLPLEQLPEVCRELRENLIAELSDNPGHFASSLGVARRERV